MMSFLMKFRWAINNNKYLSHKIRTLIIKVRINKTRFKKKN